MDQQINELDASTDIMVGRYTSADELKQYLGTSFKVKAAAFLLCTKGTIRCNINTIEYTIEQYNVVTLLPNSFMQVHEISEHVQVYYVAFSSDFMGHINFVRSMMNCISHIYKKPIVPIPQNTARLFDDCYDILFRYAAYPNTLNNKEMVKAIFMMCSQGIVELYQKSEKLNKHELNRDTEIYQEFMHLLLKYYTTQHNVSFYAEQLGLTPSYFSTSIRKATGKKPLEVIVQTLITDAKAQLKGTNLEIKNIAIGLGFSNLSFFNKFFRQHVGMTPQEYRGKNYTY